MKNAGKYREVKAWIIVLSLFLFSPIFLLQLWTDQKKVLPECKIILVPVQDFGKNTDWESLFYDTSKSMAISRKGEIFVLNSLQHTITKFSQEGKILKTFGRMGQGPGDLFFPTAISILDEKYLVVLDKPGNKKISLFDLEGNIIKVLKIRNDAFKCLGLKENIIAMEVYQLNTKNTDIKKSVLLYNVETGKQIYLTSFLTVNKHIKINGMLYYPGNFSGSFVLNKTSNDDLIVGFTTDRQLKIFSCRGELVKTIVLEYPLTPISEEQVELYKSLIIDSLQKDKFPGSLVQGLKKTSFAEYLPGNFPLFSNILVGPGDLIWVFPYKKFPLSDNSEYYWYNLGGGSCLSHGEIDFLSFKLNVNAPLIFHDQFLYGLLEIKDSEDISLRLSKFKVIKNYIGEKEQGKGVLAYY